MSGYVPNSLCDPKVKLPLSFGAGAVLAYSKKSDVLMQLPYIGPWLTEPIANILAGVGVHMYCSAPAAADQAQEVVLAGAAGIAGASLVQVLLS